MIRIEPTKPISRPVYRVELPLGFSERRLLLFLGDVFMIVLAGGVAFWLHTLIR
jgi:hypothetical protein